MSKNKPGRDLELLIASIEGAMAPLGASLQSPGRVVDADGVSREIDVLVEFRVGSVDTRIGFECRDRGRRQDKMWIEELAGRKESLQLSRIVAVSRGGFSKPAIAAANRVGIVVRDVSPISAIELASIAHPGFFRCRHVQWELLKAAFVPVSAEHSGRSLVPGIGGGVIRLDSEIMQRVGTVMIDGDGTSAVTLISKVFNQFLRQSTPIDLVQDGETKEVRFFFRDNTVEVNFGESSCRMAAVQLHLKAHVTETSMVPTRGFRVSQGDSVVNEFLELKSDVGEYTVQAQVVRDHVDGTGRVRLLGQRNRPAS